MATTNDIVVVGRRPSETAGGKPVEQTRVVNNTGDAPVDASTGGNASDGTVTASVNVQVANPANREKALEAARNIAAAVAQIIDAGSTLPYNTLIDMPNGTKMKVGDLVALAKTTKFIVSDQPPPKNNGVGGADAPNKTDTLQYMSFSDGNGVPTYSAPGYFGQGMLGIMLHELGHLSPEGYSNWDASVKAFQREMTIRKLPQNQFYNSDFSADNEKFAHEFAMSSGGVLGIPLGVYDHYYKPPSPYVGPDGVTRQHIEDNGW